MVVCTYTRPQFLYCLTIIYSTKPPCAIMGKIDAHLEDAFAFQWPGQKHEMVFPLDCDLVRRMVGNTLCLKGLRPSKILQKTTSRAFPASMGVIRVSRACSALVVLSSEVGKLYRGHLAEQRGITMILSRYSPNLSRPAS